ncbi:zinc metallopeptidase [Pseudobutyrivibrio sp.]|uniref:zinc metallopeptidase n=1 Tax=Pseudobutyrivibrio sp. TaxID=2014367 RepID=UPI001B3D8EF7|nr:zinc metallopeptidase [Pseudobutyrivibrio sp.]MBP5594731.1 zinc metallopeptidase [Pseudobutyrivibrio sp.]MBR5649837.1 zinc metallopeptidase [Pseudobutyrivibrio sp.]
MYYGYGYGMGYHFDWTIILVLIGAVISGLASINVNRTYSKYNRVHNYRGLTSNQVAEHILHAAGIYDVRIERIRGNLTDHYSPKEKVLRLSDSVYGRTSVAAIGVAAHECGHAIQHQEDYAPLRMRSASVPLANIGSWVSWPVILIGLLIGSTPLAQLGIFLFTFVVLFQLITLPVEFDASARALRILEQDRILEGEEHRGATRVLKAAAMTYVAALFTTIMQLLRLVLIVNGRSRDD